MREASDKRRINIIDTGRGAMMILVMWFHLSYDLYYIFGKSVPYMEREWVYIFRDCFVGVLILISGISCNLTRSNKKRGLKTFLIGLLITIGTYFFMPSELIVFGILHFFGASMTLYGLLEKPFIKIPVLPGAVIFLLLFFASYYFVFIERITAPEGSVFLKAPLNLFLFIMGIRTGISSADYYPLIPWIFLFFSGAFIGRDIKKRELPEFFYRDYCFPVSFIGRHTLIIYLVHQPLLLGLLWIVMR